jgi:hypothetical protein
MEESGHYYTVYFTSLAVGFEKDIAKRQALLAQMPDEVGWTDAANMHINQCANRPASLAAGAFSSVAGGVFGGLAGGYAADRYFQEYDLGGKLQRVPNEWRYTIEFALHSLKDKSGGSVSSQYQRDITRRLLLKNAPDSLTFGLLLHRLGDTYAHSTMANENIMYTTTSTDKFTECIPLLADDSLGHRKDMHDPDYPHLRTELFDKYLRDLHSILEAKYNENVTRRNSPNKKKTLTAVELSGIFKDIFNNLKKTHSTRHTTYGRGGMMVVGDENAARPADDIVKDFIAAIRKKCYESLGIEMDKYAPEKIEKQTLGEFLNDHRAELQGVNRETLTQAIYAIYRGVNVGHGSSGSW